MDHYYCLINITSSNIILYLFQHKYLQKYPLCLVSYSSSKIYKLMSLHDVFTNLSLSHILYLGQEIYKAELSIELGQKYMQN